MENLFNQKIFDINWDNNKTIYEHRNFNFDINKKFDKEIGIVIDNGSYECKAGWSCFQDPNLIFKTIVAKPKVQNKNADKEGILVGNDILTYEQGKLNKKSPYDKNIIMHFGTQEHILDHIFTSLNIRDSGVNHPVIFTEPFANLNWSRKNMTEMFFELYNVPKLCFGVDMLYSMYYNEKNNNNFGSSKKSNDMDALRNCLIISSSYQSTYITPILKGKVNIDKTRRISIGGFHNNDLLGKSLHLKYPDFKNKITPEIVQDIQEKYTYCAKNYSSQLKLLEKIFEYDLNIIREDEKRRMFGGLEMYEKAYAEDNKQKNKLLYNKLKPYKNSVEYNNSILANENSVYGNNDFDEKFVLNEDENSELIKDLIFFEWPKPSFEKIISEEDIKLKQELRKEQIKRLRESMQKKKEENIRNLEKELKELEELVLLKNIDKYQFEEAIMTKGFSNFDEIQKRMNKIFLKLNFDKKDDEKLNLFDEEKRWPLLNVPDEDLNAEQIKNKKIQRMQKNAYLSRLEKREAQKKEKEKVEELKQKDPEKYLLNLYIKKKEILERLKNYKQIKKDLSNRLLKMNMRRMVVLAELGGEADKPPSSTRGKKDNQSDDFGINDEDWEIYRGISRHNISEDEEEDQNQLNEIEAQIMEMDPNYFKYNENYVQSSILNKYLFLGVDQFRGAELMFQPNILGVDQAGIVEIILSILKTLTLQEQKEICSNIFLTGGNMHVTHIEDRIFRELRGNLDCDIPINIVKAFDPILDAWKGARLFMNEEENQSSFITKAEYEEFGPEYMKEHRCGNLLINSFDFAAKKASQNNESLYVSNDYYEPTKKPKLH